MSSRQMRRLREKLEAEKLEKKESEDSEEDFEPLYVNKHKASYNLLSANVLADNENEQQSGILKDMNDTFSLLSIEESDAVELPPLDDDSSSDEPPAPVTAKKNKNNKTKKRIRQRRANSRTDEVEQAVAEVNSILGMPSTAPPAESLPIDLGKTLIQVNHKFLNADEELTRRFGPDLEEGKKHQRPDVLRLLKRQISLPNKTYNFTLNGLTMEQIVEKDGVKHFQLVHSPRYQANVRGVVAAVKSKLSHFGPPDYDIFSMITLEALLQNVDLYFMLEETTSANNALENAIYFLQSIFCSSFNYFDGKSILRYDIVENRPFHIILLKYMHMLTNKACHRTALEIAKILLNLDPSDPLGVIFIVDTIALRAREHQWLIDIYKVWSEEKDASKLFHLQYSHALARYHIYLKNKNPDDLKIAEECAIEAMKVWPNVTMMLFAHCLHVNPDVSKHEVFTELDQNTVSTPMMELQRLYVAFSGPKWREGSLIQWLSACAVKLCKDYDNNPDVKLSCSNMARTRTHLFRDTPIEIKRHLFVIRSMSSLLVDGAVPKMRDTYSFSPYPLIGTCVDRHGYFTEVPASGEEELSKWRAFLESLFPTD